MKEFDSGPVSLFGEGDLSQYLDEKEKGLRNAIDRLGGDTLLNSSLEEWCDFLEQEYSFDIPRLADNQVETESRETNIGVTVTFHLPFEGDKHLLRLRPSTYTLRTVPAVIAEGSIRLKYDSKDYPDAAKMRVAFLNDLGGIQQGMTWMEADVTQFNSSIGTKARARLRARLAKVQGDRNLVEALGFPLKERNDSPRTFIVPEIRRRIAVPQPRASGQHDTPEYRLEMGDYEHILWVISNMALVMEKSPHVFHRIEEEDLRWHFVVQLNGHYEGSATGETFHGGGKADILIEVNGRNIFIAECKYWDGPKSLREALDQLSGYATWRDTKVAVLVFNRQKRFSWVLKQIPEVLEEHPNFKRHVPHPSETGFRCVVHHPNDVDRDMTLTVLAFNVPV